MARVNKIIQSLNAGELSPLMDMRLDQVKYQAGCRTLENFYPLIYGGVERRPGTIYVGAAKSSSAKCRLVSFIYSVDYAYILEFGNQYIRFYYDGGRVVGGLYADTSAWANSTAYVAGDFAADASNTTIYRCLVNNTSSAAPTTFAEERAAYTTYWEAAALTSDLYPIYEIPTPYLTADLFELKFEHSADVSYITHPDYEPRKLSRVSATTWTLECLAFDNGPFLDENVTVANTITASATTGSVTLTASAATFITGTTAGHSPSGSTPTSKSQTGALFKIVHSLGTGNVDKKFTAISQSSTPLLVYKGVHWDFVTNGTWTGQITLERSYDSNGTYGNGVWEVVHTVSSENNANAKVDMVETNGDAYYCMVSALGAAAAWSGTANCQFSVRDQSHIGIVKITAVASTTSATATVLTTLANTTATHRWSEGYWSNYRGWPCTVAISPEERLCFGGSPTYPLTVWGTKIGDYTDMTAGALDDDAIIFTLIGSGEQNRIRWMLSKDILFIGTYGGELTLGSSDEEQPMTPTNVKSKIQSTLGSADIQAIIVNNCIIFVQRGGRRIREIPSIINPYSEENQDPDDLTVLANHITESTIVDLAYQRTPDPMLWCVRNDGRIAVLSYDRKQEVFAWSILHTTTSAGESDFESVAIIPSGSEEDEIWVSVERVINGATVRYIEYFSTRSF